LALKGNIVKLRSEEVKENDENMKEIRRKEKDDGEH
jgi:hypothetical protein